MMVHQKLCMILEKKVVPKLKLENNEVFFYQKWSRKLIFLNEIFFLLILDIENRL